MTRVEWTRLQGNDAEAVAMFVNREHSNSVRMTPSRGDGGVDIHHHFFRSAKRPVEDECLYAARGEISTELRYFTVPTSRVSAVKLSCKISLHCGSETPHLRANDAATARRSVGSAARPAILTKGPSVSRSTRLLGICAINFAPFSLAIIDGLIEKKHPASDASSRTEIGPEYQWRTAEIPEPLSRLTTSRAAPRLWNETTFVRIIECSRMLSSTRI